MVTVAGRRSVTSGRPPMLSISQRPASSGCGSAGRVSTARTPSLPASTSVRSSGRLQLATWSKKLARRRSLATAAVRSDAEAEAHNPVLIASRRVTVSRSPSIR